MFQNFFQLLLQQKTIRNQIKRFFLKHLLRVLSASSSSQGKIFAEGERSPIIMLLFFVVFFSLLKYLCRRREDLSTKFLFLYLDICRRERGLLRRIEASGFFLSFKKIFTRGERTLSLRFLSFLFATGERSLCIRLPSAIRLVYIAPCASWYMRLLLLQ